MKIYDAENQIVGRMATTIAKDLLNGEKVVVVNCEKSVLAGKAKFKEKFYGDRVKRGNPAHGPYFPRQPDGIFRRAVRGMLPWQKSNGRKAYRNLDVFIGVPSGVKKDSMQKINVADAGRLKIKYVKLGDLSEMIGAKKRW